MLNKMKDVLISCSIDIKLRVTLDEAANTRLHLCTDQSTRTPRLLIMVLIDPLSNWLSISFHQVSLAEKGTNSGASGLHIPLPVIDFFGLCPAGLFS